MIVSLIKMDKGPIDLLAILQKSLDRALFLYIFIHEVRSSGPKVPLGSFF